MFSLYYGPVTIHASTTYSRYDFSSFSECLIWMLEGYRDGCDCCGKHIFPMEIDHDHNSHHIRGLVCRRCNAITNVKHEPDPTRWIAKAKKTAEGYIPVERSIRYLTSRSYLNSWKYKEWRFRKINRATLGNNYKEREFGKRIGIGGRLGLQKIIKKELKELSTWL